MIFYNKYVKRVLGLFFATLLLLSLAACSKGSGINTDSISSEDEADFSENAVTVAVTSEPVVSAKYTIGVLLLGDSEDDLAAYNGFLDAFEHRDFEQNGVHHNIILAQCKNEKELDAKASEFVSKNVDLVFAVGEKAAISAAKATETIPVVFCSVADPIEAGLLTSASAPDKNITGVSDFTPYKEQMEFLRTLYPNAKKVSAVYCATDAKSILVSNFAKIEAEDLGVEYNSFTASNEHQLAIAVESAAKDGDVIYLCEDELTLEQADLIFKTAKEKNTPVFSSSSAFMEKGAVATSLPDYTELGYDAGELALIILKNIKPISEIAVEYPKVCVNYINEKYIDKLPGDSDDVTVY